MDDRDIHVPYRENFFIRYNPTINQVESNDAAIKERGVKEAIDTANRTIHAVLYDVARINGMMSLVLGSDMDVAARDKALCFIQQRIAGIDRKSVV